MLYSPLETADIGCAKTQLTRTLNHEEALGKLLLQCFYDGCSAIRRTILDDENVECLLQAKYGSDNVLDVFFLVIRRYDNDAIAILHAEYID